MSINHIFNGGFYEPINPAAWSNVINGGGGGGGVLSVSGTTNQIAISGTNANPIVSFPVTGIDTPNLTVNSAYTLPTTLGTANQVLAMPASGTQCVWKNDTAGSGTVTSVSGDANFIVTNGTTTPSISLASTVEIDTLNIHNAYTLPTSIGSANQVLAVPATGTTLVWANDIAGSGTVTNVSNTDGNLTVTNGSTTPVINLANSISVGGLTVGTGMYALSGNFTGLGLADTTSNPVFNFPLVSANPAINSLIVADGGAGSTFSEINNLIINTDNNISLTNNGSNIAEVNLANSINVGALSVNSAYSMPTSIGTSGQVLSVGGGTGLTWTTVGGGTGDITDVLGTTNQIAVTNSSGPQPQIGFPTAANGIQFPNNIITNVSTQGSSSGVVAIGPNCLTGINNTFIDSQLIGIGASAFGSLTSVGGLNEVSIGNYSSTFLGTGSNYNVVVGNQSLADTNNVSPNGNVVIGTFSGQSISNGNNNVIVGNSTMSTSPASGNNGVNNNIVIGDGSLQNAGTTSQRNIILGNNVNLGTTGDSNNFLVDPTNITNMQIGNIISGNASELIIPNMKFPFNTYPTLSGQVLSSDTSGNMSWISGTGMGDITDVLGTANQIAVTNSGGPQATVGFCTPLNNFIAQNNIITNGQYQTDNRFTAIGYNALQYMNQICANSDIIAIGCNALSAISPYSNIEELVIGNNSGTTLNALGNYNVVVGHNSLDSSFNSAANNTVILGSNSGSGVTIGADNIILGNDSFNNPSNIVPPTNLIHDNIVIGNHSLQNGYTGMNNNIIIGNNLELPNPNGNDQLVLGSVLTGTPAGLSIPNMQWPFNVLPSSNGQVLTSDTGGNMSWQQSINYLQNSTPTSFTNVGGGSIPISFVSYENISGSTHTTCTISNNGAPFQPAGFASNIWSLAFQIPSTYQVPNNSDSFLLVNSLWYDSNGNQGYALFYYIPNGATSYILMVILDLTWGAFPWSPGTDYYFGSTSIVNTTSVTLTW